MWDLDYQKGYTHGLANIYRPEMRYGYSLYLYNKGYWAGRKYVNKKLF